MNNPKRFSANRPATIRWKNDWPRPCGPAAVRKHRVFLGKSSTSFVRRCQAKSPRFASRIINERSRSRRLNDRSPGSFSLFAFYWPQATFPRQLCRYVRSILASRNLQDHRRYCRLAFRGEVSLWQPANRLSSFCPRAGFFPSCRAISPLSRRDNLIIFNCQSCRARGRFGSGGERSSRTTYELRRLSKPLAAISKSMPASGSLRFRSSFSRYLRIRVVLAAEITEIKGRRIARWLTKATSIRAAANIGLLLSTHGWKMEEKSKKHEEEKKRLCFTVLR